MFSVNERTRAKHLDKVNEIVTPDGATAIAYGTQAFAMNGAAWGILAATVGIMVIGALLGALLVPGFLFIILFLQQARPQRVVAVTAHQIVVLSRGSFVASPKAVVAAAPRFPVAPQAEEFTVGATTVKLATKEMARIAAASVAFGAPVPTAPTHPYVVPTLGADADVLAR